MVQPVEQERSAEPIQHQQPVLKYHLWPKPVEVPRPEEICALRPVYIRQDTGVRSSRAYPGKTFFPLRAIVFGGPESDTGGKMLFEIVQANFAKDLGFAVK